MRKRNDQLRKTAIHEAGHAVIAHVVGARIHRATVKSGDGYLGKVRHARTLSHATWYANDDRAHLRLGREIKISLAGPLAERRAYPGSRWRTGAHNDYIRVADRVDHIYPSMRKGDAGWRAQGHFWKLMEIETDWLLTKHWHCVKAVAKELLERETISGAQIRAAIFRANEDDLRRRLDKQAASQSAAGSVTKEE